MHQKSTRLICGFLLSNMVMAGTPVIDGVFDGESVWGAPVATGDGVAGWAGANAKKLYVTYDANYVYFGAEFTSTDWQQFIFVVNTKEGGGRTDAWGRTISYDHTNAPDFLLRGDIAKGNYMEFHIWQGENWGGTGTNRNAGGTEAKGLSGDFGDTKDGFIEIRVSREIIGDPAGLDVQFVIGGNNGGTDNGHGCFDAVPNDNNGTAWSAPGNFTRISNYASNVVLPASLSSFAGELRGTTVTLRWQTLTEEKVSAFYVEQSRDARNWYEIGRVAAKNATGGASYQHSLEKFGAPVGFFRLRVADKDGSFAYSQMVMLKSESKAKAEIIGNPVRQSINVAIHTSAPERINAEVVDMNGRRIVNTIYQHPGGSSIMEIPAGNMPGGLYMLRLHGTEIHETIRMVKM
jgi:hypothetical protein